MNKTTLIVLTAALIGLAAGFGLARPAANGVTIVATSTASSEVRAAKTESPTSDAAREITRDDVIAKRNELLKELPPIPRVETGSGSISGRVITADGKGVADAIVRCDLEKPNQRYPVLPPKGPSARDQLREPYHESNVMIERYVLAKEKLYKEALREVRHLTTTTDADGYFLFENLSDVYCILSAAKKGFGIHRLGGSRRILPGQSQNLLAEPIYDVEFEVLLPDGTRAPHARIAVGDIIAGAENITGKPRHFHDGWLADSRVMQFKESIYEVKASATIHELAPRTRYSSETVEFRVEPGRKTPLVTLQLRLETSLTVTLHYEWRPQLHTEPPVVRYMVLAEGESPPDLKSSDRRIHKRKGHGRLGIAAKRGYRIAIAAGWTQEFLGETEILNLEEGDNTHVLKLKKPSPERYTQVKLTSPSGFAAIESTLSAGYRKPGGNTKALFLDSLHVEPGVFLVPRELLRPLSGADFTELERYVNVAHPEFGIVRRYYDAESDREIEIAFERPGALNLKIDGVETDTMREALYLRLIKLDQDDPIARVASVYGARNSYRKLRPDEFNFDEDSRVRLTGLAPGRYRMELQLHPLGRQFRGRHFYPITRGLEITSGSSSLDLRVPEMHSLTATCTRLEKGETLWLRSLTSDTPKSSLAVDEGGSATFQLLLPGTYELRARVNSKTVRAKFEINDSMTYTLVASD